jgi:hypothetical protein
MLFQQRPLTPWSLTPWGLVGAAAAWPAASHQQARRNALVGATALAKIRRERLDVEEYLAGRDASSKPVTGVRHSA